MGTEKRYKFISDPGHGWLEVPIEELHALGIADQITRWSYINGGMAYLEEDCDMGVFARAKGWASILHAPIDDVYQENTAIRGYRSYKQINQKQGRA